MPANTKASADNQDCRNCHQNIPGHNIQIPIKIAITSHRSDCHCFPGIGIDINQGLQQFIPPEHSRSTAIVTKTDLDNGNKGFCCTPEFIAPIDGSASSMLLGMPLKNCRNKKTL
jgi:hypothetical protein